MKKLLVLITFSTLLIAKIITPQEVDQKQYVIQLASLASKKVAKNAAKEFSTENVYITKSKNYYVLYLVNLPTKELANKRLKQLSKKYKGARIRSGATLGKKTTPKKTQTSFKKLKNQVVTTENNTTTEPKKDLPLEQDPLFMSKRKEGFTLYEAIVYSLAQNPKIKASRERVIQANKSVAEREAGHLPSIDLSGDAGYETRTYQADYESGNKAAAPQTDLFHYKKTELYLTITENLWSGGSIENSVEEQAAKRNGLIYDHRNNLERAALDIIEAYFEVVYSEIAVNISRKNMLHYKEILKIVTIKEQNGASTKGDVNFIAANVDNAQTALVQTEARLSDAMARYEYLMKFIDKYNLPYETEVPLFFEDLNTTLKLMNTNNAKLMRQKSYIASSEYTFKAQRGDYHPKVDLALNGESRNEFDKGLGQRDKANALITFSYNLYKGGKDEAKSLRLLSKLNEQRYIYEDEKRQLTFDTKVLHRSVFSLSDSLKHTENEVIAARKVVKSYWIAFKHGTQDLQALQLAQRNLNRAELDYAKYKKNLIIDNFKLMKNSGELLKFLDVTYDNHASQFQNKEPANFWY